MKNGPVSGGRTGRLRFSLRALFVLVTLCGIWIGFQARAVHNESHAVAELEKLGCYMMFPEPRHPQWFWNTTDGHYANTVTEVWATDGEHFPAALPHLSKLCSLRKLLILFEPGGGKAEATVARTKRLLPSVRVFVFGPGIGCPMPSTPENSPESAVSEK